MVESGYSLPQVVIGYPRIVAHLSVAIVAVLISRDLSVPPSRERHLRSLGGGNLHQWHRCRHKRPLRSGVKLLTLRGPAVVGDGGTHPLEGSGNTLVVQNCVVVRLGVSIGRHSEVVEMIGSGH